MNFFVFLFSLPGFHVFITHPGTGIHVYRQKGPSRYNRIIFYIFKFVNVDLIKFTFMHVHL